MFLKTWNSVRNTWQNYFYDIYQSFRNTKLVAEKELAYFRASDKQTTFSEKKLWFHS